MDDDEDPSGNSNDISQEMQKFVVDIISEDVSRELKISEEDH
jgi:hypothetical protein